MDLGPRKQRPAPKDIDVEISGDSTGSSSEDVSIHDDTVSNSNNVVSAMQRVIVRFITNNKKLLAGGILLLLLAGYIVYFVFAIMYNVEWAAALIVFTGLTAAYLLYMFITDRFGESIDVLLTPASNVFDKVWPVLKWFFYPAIFIALVLYLSLVVVQEGRQLQSCLGFVIFMSLMYLTSKHPGKVNWRPVFWGLILQFVFAILVLRWKYGYIAIKFLADEINKFIQYGFAGAAAVFGDPFLVFHPFAFMGMPLLIYLGAVMSILYYYGITQWTAAKLGWLMQKTLGTTAIETLNLAANIFLDGMNTLLMIRRYIENLTLSEFNCVLVGNHATVAGFVFALFVLFGAPPQHLLSAAFMSAPATIAICKLHYPETEVSRTKNMEDVKLSKGDEINLFEAAANGAAIASKTVAAVLGCYIAFLSMLAFINATLSWLGGRVGYDELSFDVICSYVMWPIAYIIGIEFDQCQESAKLIGLKIFGTEILAYQELGKSVDAGLLNPRSEALTTYAMCGFSSISTLAIAIGVWQSICPSRVKLMASLMFRALLQANTSCFMTACVAGLFYSDEIADFFDKSDSPQADLITALLGIVPGYKQLLALAGV